MNFGYVIREDVLMGTRYAQDIWPRQTRLPSGEARRDRHQSSQPNNTATATDTRRPRTQAPGPNSARARGQTSQGYMSGRGGRPTPASPHSTHFQEAMWAWYFPSYLLKRTHSFTHTHTREVRPPPPPPAGKYFLDLRGRQKCLFLKN